MKKIIVITGTPTSGKTTISEKLARRIKGAQLIKANDLVKERKLFRGYSHGGEMIADMKKLKSEIERRIKESSSDFIILEGHLLCDIKIRGATAIVIREHLKVLLNRMRKRKYSKKKIEGNIVSEAIDYCGVNAVENYDSVYEVRGGGGAVKEIIRIIGGKRATPGEIDMLGELNGLAKLLKKAAL